jgi:oligoribonuclease NrnB/cAMP/cGMP phosphodiesterase (DHH superfamily)
MKITKRSSADNIKCFHHNDLDGECAGAIVKIANPKCKTISIGYEDDFPWDSISKSDIIYMVDFSLQPFSEMEKLHSMCKEFIWIDHHASALLEYSNSDLALEGIQEDGKAGCELTWEYFYPDKEMPKAVYYIGRFDVWDHEHDENIVNFKYGMEQFDSEETSPDNHLWKDIFSNKDQADKIVEDGKIVKKYYDSRAKILSKAIAFDTIIDGYKAIVMNAEGNSQLFDSVWDEDKYDLMLLFVRKKGQWTISMYSTQDSVDVSVIAKNHGGGGHKGASGFQCKELPFDI